MRRLSFFVLCAACFALAFPLGCGGDEEPEPKPDAGPPVPPVPDSGPPDAGKPDAGPLDLVPPVVEATLPANGAVAVPPESSVEITFSEPMQTDRGTLQLLPGTGLPNNGVLLARPQDWDITKKKVMFTFPQGLPRKTKLTADVGNFADVAGNPMRTLHTFSFTVSEGTPPSVSTAAPAEGASSVPLTTSEVSINFNEPMDITVGTLVPDGGLTLGAVSWIGNQALKAPITSELVNDGLYSVRLDGFRNVHGKALDGVRYLEDGELDFGTGPDTIPPTVRDSSPKEGAIGVQHENTLFIVFVFSEPMDTTAGKAEVVDGSNPRITLVPQWSQDKVTVTYDAQFKLRPSADLRVDLTGFKDLAGKDLDLSSTGYLGANGDLDFTMAADTVKPYVTTTNIQEGATDVYPVEVYASGGTTAGQRKVFTFRFSEPMDDSISLVTLHEESSPGTFRSFSGLWSSDRLTLTVTVTPPVAGQPPLLGDRDYHLDLTRLKDPTGNPLDATIPVLGDGKLDFRTLANQPDLNHACEHALTQAPLAVTATASATASTPRADQLHRYYEITLPGSGINFSGYVKARLITNQTQPIFLSQEVPLMVTDPASPTTGIGVTLEPVPSACAELTHVARFGTTLASELNLKFGPIGTTKFRLVLEDTF